MKKKFELIKDIKTKGIDNTNNILLEQVKQEQETIKNDLGDLGDIVNDNNSKINNKLDTSIFNNYQQSNDNKVNELSTQQQSNTSDISNLKNDVDGINDNFNNYYTKLQIDEQQNNQNTQINNKQDIIKSTDTLTYKKWDLGDNINLFKYSNNELVVNYNQKLSFIDRNDNRITFLENGVIDGYYKDTEILNNATRIIELGNNKVMVIAQMSLTNYRNNGQDLYNGLPSELRNLNNVRQIEYFEYNFIQYSNNVNKVFTNYVGNIAASVYNNRIYLRNEMALPSYVNYLRFKLIYDKI